MRAFWMGWPLVEEVVVDDDWHARLCEDAYDLDAFFHCSVVCKKNEDIAIFCIYVCAHRQQIVSWPIEWCMSRAPTDTAIVGFRFHQGARATGNVA